MREANDKSGFTQPKKGAANETLFSDRKNDTAHIGDSAYKGGPFERNDAKPTELTVKQLLGPNVVHESPEKESAAPSQIQTVYASKETDQDDETMAGNGTMDPKLSKMLAKKNKGGKGSSGRNSGRNSQHKLNAVQTLDHRLVYLNPKERARRDLETRHG